MQADLGINPKHPRDSPHGSFSFDVSNGACGVLTAFEIADGFIRSGVVENALVVAGDSDPGHGLARSFPYDAVGAAVVCREGEDGSGFAGFRFDRAPEESGLAYSRVSYSNRRNRLEVETSEDFAGRAAPWAAKNVSSLLADLDLRPHSVDLVIANPLSASFREMFAYHAGIDEEVVLAVPGAERVLTAAPLLGLATAAERGWLRGARRVLMVSAGAGIVVGAGLMVV